MTIFSVPRSFVGSCGLRQRNAISSWQHLQPVCEVVLCGDDPGVAETAHALSVSHLPTVRKNICGTPLVNSVFEAAEKHSQNKYLCFVNTDIILMSDFIVAARRLCAIDRPFLMIGSRRNVTITEPLSFDPGWERRLQLLVRRNASIGAGLDFFLYPRGLWRRIPPFAFGRVHWDNWFPYAARLQGAMVVDVTPVTTVIHQEHDVSCTLLQSAEVQTNWDLLIAEAKVFGVSQATHLMTSVGINVRCNSCDPLCVCNPIATCCIP
jgi:hypothetical protein